MASHPPERSLRLAIGLVGLMASVAPCFSQAAADDEQKYRAAMEQFFLGKHAAIPLFSNGTVFSGDVIDLSTEATVVSRKVCYDLGEPLYRRMLKDSTRKNLDFDGSVGISVPLEKLGNIALEISGEAERLSSVSLDPLSQEQPENGTSELQTPKGDPACDVITNILRGLDGQRILVTRVFHGIASVESAIRLGGGVSGSAQITNEKLREVVKAVLGDDPKIHAATSGTYATVGIGRADQPMSLAVQSNVIDATQLGEMYIRYLQKKDQLKDALDRYYKEKDKSVLDTLRNEIEQLLNNVDLFFGGVTKFYQTVFAGSKVVPIEVAKLTPEHWEALGTIAAANEIARKQ